MTEDDMDHCKECSEIEWLVDGWCERCRESLDPNFQPWGESLVPHSTKQHPYIFVDAVGCLE